jgi:CheY-like chemotaxis protein
MTKPSILCVDDEPNVVSGLAMQLRRDYEVVGASSGAEGLARLRERAGGPEERAFAAVVSDMRMPEMDGARFLAEARVVAPDATRILLTGYSEFEAAIRAVNEGGLFRFLLKPCPPDELRVALRDAVEQHRLVVSERVLLEQTLRGSVRTLLEILAMTHPAAFGRAERVRRRALELAEQTKLGETWALDLAAMLAHLGEVIVPEPVLRKASSGGALSADEQRMFARTGHATERWLANIPRLEPVRAVLAAAGRTPARTGASPSPSLAAAARLLVLANDFDALEEGGDAPERALEVLRGRRGRYDTRDLDALAALLGAEAATRSVREVGAHELREGMTFADDVHTREGVLLVARGHAVTAALVERFDNYGHGFVREPLRVWTQAPRD